MDRALPIISLIVAIVAAVLAAHRHGLEEGMFRGAELCVAAKSK